MNKGELIALSPAEAMMTSNCLSSIDIHKNKVQIIIVDLMLSASVLIGTLYCIPQLNASQTKVCHKQLVVI